MAEIKTGTMMKSAVTGLTALTLIVTAGFIVLHRFNDSIDGSCGGRDYASHIKHWTYS